MSSTESIYAKAHKSLGGPGDARPTALQIVQDENRVNDLTDKVIMITGCSSGLGIETAKALFHTGATLYLTARDLGKAKTALGNIVDSPRVHLLHLDLNSLATVRACAEEFKSIESTLNILIENAGVMACPEGRTADGFEMQFGTNHLAHFLLFYLLKPLLLSSSTSSFQSRVVVVASSAHRVSSVHFDNITFEGEYEPWKAYGQSKTANIWTANEIERRYGSKGLHAFSLHPGAIATELLRHVSDEQKSAWDADDWLKKYWKSPEQGAATSVWGAVARELEGTGGKYLDNCQIASPADPTKRHGPGYATWAYNPDGEAKLWTKTLELLKLKDE
ncbi:hypothetical protein BDV27DRAFT_132011 [Aspergillus caelatus]|uniref:Short-chain dehydrogenase n=2 Tax=Aspergillus subgen. Circumdati TaxID=2720871 RepID=A0A5N6ZXA1_9EURO|nr:uncharacterized protein BDV27DRAFT_132011 [Aspergillus caelatus]KAE8362152.1 hypothetical protein BDV27DRAFT_132011 [Aspergillus caelatus]KAE8413923.1 hypothetical protein BDV36DRAFT_267081 [Aspergillus pseudocaelatus]